MEKTIKNQAEKPKYVQPELPKEPIIRIENQGTILQPQKILNINLGVLGHIDSGKTSLCKSLSTVASTASFDKNPQSKERGITLDLGFSAFIIEIPKWFREKHEQKLDKYEYLQFTLVDCPGHASLMKTIIGGASIIDFMMLVIDSQKLIQTQTAECIVLGEILMDKLIIALNKVDLYPNFGEGDPDLQQQIKKLRTRFKNTKFGAFLPIVQIAACPKPDAQNENSEKQEDQKQNELNELVQNKEAYGIENLIKTILYNIEIPNREGIKNQSFLFSIDHCFQIKGQGTVMTGTVLQGEVNIGDTIEIPNLKLEKKVKSMQMFRKPVKQAKQGDRVGICVAQLEADQIERGIACSPRTIKSCETVLAVVQKIKFFTDQVINKTKFHITIGHQTAIGQVHFFSMDLYDQEYQSNENIQEFNFQIGNFKNQNQKPFDFDHKKQYEFENELLSDKPIQNQMQEEKKQSEIQNEQIKNKMYFAIIQLEKPVLIQQNSLLIASKLDMDISAKQCRIAFYGQVIKLISEPEKELPSINVVKQKLKIGKVDRINDSSNILIRDLFQKETSPDLYVGLKVTLAFTRQTGTILGSFGKSGKLKVKLDSDLPNEIMENQKDILNTEVELWYKKSVWSNKNEKKLKNKFKFN